MNIISKKRIGVDGIERNLDDIRDYLVGEIESGIYSKLTTSPGLLGQGVVNDIILHLHDILTADPVELKRIADDVDANYMNVFCMHNNNRWVSTDLGKKLLKAFNYQGYRENVLVNVAKMLNVKTCPYCNMHYTLYANEYRQGRRKLKISKITRFQFDHFFDKMRYPMLSMSFYNLIPSCSICNQGKSAKHLALAYHPYASNIGKQFHFELAAPLDPYTSARVKDEVEINLVPIACVNQHDFDTYGNTFHLKSLYSRHGDVVQEVFDKAYEDPYYLNPANFNFLSNRATDYLKQLWLGNYVKQEDIEKRPLAKFMQDLWKQAKGE